MRYRSWLPSAYRRRPHTQRPWIDFDQWNQTTEPRRLSLANPV